MTATHSLSFAATPWTLGLSTLAVVATAVLCLVAWRRSGFKRSVGVLELMRLAGVLMAAILLNQPEWVEVVRPEEKASIVVLWDASPSMETRDVARGSSQPESRREAIEPLTRPESWSKLGNEVQVVIQPFSPKGEGHGTDLNDPLARALDTVPNLRGVVLASDGDWNEGQPPVLAASKLRMKGVPVFAVPVGSPTRLPDVELLSLDSPTFGVAGKSVRIPFTIDSSMPRAYTTIVTLKTSDGDVVTKEVRVEPMGKTTDELTWKPRGTGDFTLKLSMPGHPDELLVDNNSLQAPISIREEKLKVLVVESYPRWEYRYLRNALSRDPGIDLSCLLFHPGLSKPGGGNKDYIKSFPKGLDELSRFDVVFLGDVGVESGQLTSEDCHQLKGLVEHQASGLVLMPGWEGREFSLLDTELGDLCPVVLDPSQPGGWGSRTPNHFELTESGRRSLLTKLADSSDENASVWEGLPGFQWYAPVIRAKAGSDVLCVHKDASNESGRLPLLVTRTFGAGKVLFMGTDGAWRWRKGVEDKYHYRFWGQVVRWMAYQRNMAKGETMRLYYVPDQPRMDQTLTLHANVMEPGGEPVRRGEVSARVTAPSGRSETVQFRPDGEEWGTFSGRFDPKEPGKYKITLSCKETKATLEASLNVQGAAAERLGRPSRPEVLEEIARVTRGKVVKAEQVGEIARTLAELPESPPLVRRLQLWCHPVVAGTLVGLLGLCWTGRKWIGLI
jgi:hypothetical protein